MSGLSDYLNSLNRDGWSTRRISEEAEKRGHKLSNATASRYLSGKHGAPGQDVIEAFAAVFHVSPASVRDAAGLPGLDQPFDLGEDGARLTGPQREAIRTTVRLFVEQNDALADRSQPDGATRGRAPLASDDERSEMLNRLRRVDLAELDADGARQVQADADELVRLPLAGEDEELVENVRAVLRGRPVASDANLAQEEPRRADYARAADDSGPSLLELDDARADARGEESQDPEDWRP